MNQARQFLYLCAVTFCAAVASVHAATVTPMNLGELIEGADSIVVGAVNSSTSEWRGDQIITQSTIKVREHLLGDDSSEITVTSLGGTALHPRLKVPVQMAVAGVPVYRPGDTILLFGKHNAAGELQAVGLSQGVFRVELNADTGAEQVSVGTKALHAEGPKTPPLDSLFSPFSVLNTGSTHVEVRPVTLQEITSKIQMHLKEQHASAPNAQ